MRATHDVGHALRRVVDHDRQLVGPRPVRPSQHEVPRDRSDVLDNLALEAIVERDDGAVGDPEADRGIGAPGTGDAATVHAARGRQDAAAAVACEGEAGVQQAIQGSLVVGAPGGLPEDAAVRMQPERVECRELSPRRPGHFARRIQVLDPDQPFATGVAREQPAAERGEQRPGMQVAGGRGGETAAVTRCHCT